MKVKLNFAATGSPTLKMVRVMTWIQDILELPTQEEIWCNFQLAGEFISEHIDEAIDVQALRYEQEKYLRKEGRWKYYLDD